MILRLLALYRPYWPWMAVSLLVALVTLLANVALMAMSGWFITAMAIAGSFGNPINYFTPAAVIRACAILRTGGRYADRVISHETTFRLLARLRVWLYRRLEPLPPGVLAAFHSGDVASRLRGDIDRLESVYLRVMTPFAVAAIGSVAVVLGLAHVATVLAVILALGLSAAGLVLPWFLAWRSADPAWRRVGLATALTERAVDGMQGMAELLIFSGAAPLFRRRFLDLGREFSAVQARLGVLNAMGQAGQMLLSNLTLWGSVVLGIPLIRSGALGGADLVMAVLAVLASFEAVAPIPAAVLSLGAVRASAQRLFSLGRQSGGAETLGDAGSGTSWPQGASLELSGVGFRYEDGAPWVLTDVGFVLPPGGRMALLGPVGSGKSTLVAVMTGLLKPSRGRIVLGGRSIDAYPDDQVRRFFSVAAQDSPLFTGTIRSNLLLAKPDASEEALWHAVRVARLEAFIRDLPEGMDTPIGEAGLTLSGGQARRLTIARALVRDAPILILDEPGEGLDPPTERDLLAAVVADLGPRSLLLITHRSNGLDLVDHRIRLDARGGR